MRLCPLAVDEAALVTWTPRRAGARAHRRRRARLPVRVPARPVIVEVRSGLPRRRVVAFINPPGYARPYVASPWGVAHLLDPRLLEPLPSTGRTV